MNPPWFHLPQGQKSPSHLPRRLTLIAQLIMEDEEESEGRAASFAEQPALYIECGINSGA